MVSWSSASSKYKPGRLASIQNSNLKMCILAEFCFRLHTCNLHCQGMSTCQEMITWSPGDSKQERAKSTKLALRTLEVIAKVFHEDAERVRDSIGDNVDHERAKYHHPAPSAIRNHWFFGFSLIACFHTTCVISLVRCIVLADTCTSVSGHDLGRFCISYGGWHLVHRSDQSDFKLPIWWNKARSNHAAQLCTNKQRHLLLR